MKNIEFEAFNIILDLAEKEENIIDGIVSWDFVSADLHIDFPEIVEGLSPWQEDDLLNFVANIKEAA